jgi:hypothetical protein
MPARAAEKILLEYAENKSVQTSREGENDQGLKLLTQSCICGHLQIRPSLSFRLHRQPVHRCCTGPTSNRRRWQWSGEDVRVRQAGCIALSGSIARCGPSYSSCLILLWFDASASRAGIPHLRSGEGEQDRTASARGGGRPAVQSVLCTTLRMGVAHRW